MGATDPGTPEEPIDILILLNIGAVFMGTALTVRDLVGERMIFQRERAVGSVRVGLPDRESRRLQHRGPARDRGHGHHHDDRQRDTGPRRGGCWDTAWRMASWSCILGLALTAITSAMVGLALSSLARSTEQVLPMLVVTIMVSMVLAGGLIPVTGRLVLDQLAWFVPARWGFAASASTVDLNSVEAGLPDDRLWRHLAGAWLEDVGMLVALAAALAGLVRYRLRLGNRAR